MKPISVTSCLLIGLIPLSFYLQAAEQPVNTVGCMVVNDGFLANQPHLLTTTPAILTNDTTKIHQLFHHDNLTIAIGAAAFIQTEQQLGWISSFKLMVQQTGKDTIMVKSSPRTNETQMMNTHLTISHNNNVGSGELLIECNTH